jgi:SAM-dependent methyltransferase
VYERSRPGYPADAVHWLLADYLTLDPHPGAAAFDSYATFESGTADNVRYPADPAYAPEPAVRSRAPYSDDATGDAGDAGGDRPATIVELAAGTGKLTSALVADGHQVIAIEPAAPMLARLGRQVPYAIPVQGVAEKIPLAESCADAVVVAQAFHWFDTDVALAEIARVLRPGGTLGLVWNYRDESVPWVRQLVMPYVTTCYRTRVRKT